MAAVGHFADHKLLSHKRHDEPVQLTIAELAGALAGGAGIEEVLTKLTLASLALMPSADYAKISIIDNNGLFTLAATSQLTTSLDTLSKRPVKAHASRRSAHGKRFAATIWRLMPAGRDLHRTLRPPGCTACCHLP